MPEILALCRRYGFMPRKRRHIRRSREQGEKLLRTAVAKLLREHGYDVLTASAIERLSGVSRKKINEQFDGKAAVIRGYLTDNDFWLPRLRKVIITKNQKASTSYATGISG